MISISGILTVISSSAFFIATLLLSMTALILTVQNYRSTARSSVLSEVFEHLFREETRSMRSIVRERKKDFLMIKKDPNYVLVANVEKAGRYIASAYDRVGFFLKANKRLTSDFLRWQGDVVLEMWDILGEWVTKRWHEEHLATIRQRHPEGYVEISSQLYTNYFEWLQKQAKLREEKTLTAIMKERSAMQTIDG